MIWVLIHMRQSSALLDVLTEEALGQLISDAIGRVQNEKAATPEDYSFFKAFIKWFKEIFGAWRELSPKLKDSDNAIWDHAAQRILSSDLTDLMTFDEYYEVNKEALIENISYSSIDDISKYDFISDEEKVLTRLDKIFKKRTRYLKKTYKKYFQFVDTTSRKTSPEEQMKQKNEMLKFTSDVLTFPLSDRYKFQNKVPELRSYNDFLKKYGNRSIPFNQHLSLKGYPKFDTEIYNKVLDLIKKENPELKSIKGHELYNEVVNFMNINYLLSFHNETQHATYGVDNTFKYQINRNISPPTLVPGHGEIGLTFEEMLYYSNLTQEEINNLPAEEVERVAQATNFRDTLTSEEKRLIESGVQIKEGRVIHNKVSMYFNNMGHPKEGRGGVHFAKDRQGSGGTVIPSAFGSLTYFYSNDSSRFKDAVILHEIQNDNIEYLFNKVKTISETDINYEEKVEQINEVYNSIINNYDLNEHKKVIDLRSKNNNLHKWNKQGIIYSLVDEVSSESMQDFHNKLTDTLSASSNKIATLETELKELQEYQESLLKRVEEFKEDIPGRISLYNTVKLQLINRINEEINYTDGAVKSNEIINKDEITREARYVLKSIFENIKRRGGIIKILPENLLAEYKEIYNDFAGDVAPQITPSDAQIVKNKIINFLITEYPSLHPTLKNIYGEASAAGIWMGIQFPYITRLIGDIMMSPTFKPRTNRSEVQKNMNVVSLLKTNSIN